MQSSHRISGKTRAEIIQFSDTDDLLDIRYDNIFKAVFTRDTPASKGALSSLISALINRRVSVEAIVTNEPPVDDTNERSIRFDISCRAESGEQINIEMCFNPKPYEHERLEYFAAKLLTSQGIRGIDKSYSDLKDSYQIAILGEKRLFPDDALVHTFQYYDAEHGVSLKGKTWIVTVELLKTETIIEKQPSEIDSREAWACFLQYLTDREKMGKINEILGREEGIAMAGETLITISRDDREQARLLSEEKYALDRQSDLVLAKREGRTEGLQIGRTEGLQEGIQQSRQEIARNLKTAGVSEDIISKTTGLSPEEIRLL